MSVETEIFQTLEKMPEQLKQELLHYAKFLISNYTEAATEEKALQKKSRLAGCMKGTFVLPLPDDFDEPLEDFEEYMS